MKTTKLNEFKTPIKKEEEGWYPVNYSIATTATNQAITWEDLFYYDDFIGMVHQQIAIDNGWANKIRPVGYEPMLLKIWDGFS